MGDYPDAITTVGHVEPVPRRVRAMLGGRTVLDTTRALYAWEWKHYPQFYIPLEDVAQGVLADEGQDEQFKLGTARLHALRLGDVHKPAAARVYGEDAERPELRGHVRFEWSALDAWFEEDEEVFVHPRSPYTRVDALRSARRVRVELEGTKLAESSSPVLVFETGLPTRYYFNRTEVDFTHLVPSETVTQCPYKGRTSGYWSVRIGDAVHADLAWAYDFPTLGLKAVSGLIAFYNEKVDIFIDGTRVPRPTTHFS